MTDKEKTLNILSCWKEFLQLNEQKELLKWSTSYNRENFLNNFDNDIDFVIKYVESMTEEKALDIIKDAVKKSIATGPGRGCYCPECESEWYEDGNYCPECGQKL